MARKKVEDELTKEMIVVEANRQFLKLDYSKVSMRAIAKALGCSHGAIYYHFSNKTDLFNAVIEKYFNILNSKLDESLQYEGEAGTKNVLMGFIEFGINYKSQYTFMFVKRDESFDPLTQAAPNVSYKKFSHTLQMLNNNRLLEVDIYSTFMSLHGFVLSYKDRVENFLAAKSDAQNHCDFLFRALVR